MSAQAGTGFTGRHMLLIMVSFFAVVIAVNFYMAYNATHSFAGLVVENSYVESQHFNEKLEAVRRQAALGWKVGVEVEADGVTVDARNARGVPIRGRVEVEMTRPTTDDDDHDLVAESIGYGAVHLPTTLAPGAWDATVTVVSAEGEHYLATRRVIIAAPPARP